MIVRRKTIHFNFFGVTKKVGRAETKRYQAEFWERRGKKHIDFFLQQRQVTTSLWSRWDCENSNLNRCSCFVDWWWPCYVFKFWNMKHQYFRDWWLMSSEICGFITIAFQPYPKWEEFQRTLRCQVHGFQKAFSNTTPQNLQKVEGGCLQWRCVSKWLSPKKSQKNPLFVRPAHVLLYVWGCQKTYSRV